MYRLTVPLKTCQIKLIQHKNHLFRRAHVRYLNTYSLCPLAATKLKFKRNYTHNYTPYNHSNVQYSSQTIYEYHHNMDDKIDHQHILQIAFGLKDIFQPSLPQKFFVYGTLRDDDNSNAKWTKDFVKNCSAESAKLYGFKLYKSNAKNYPFALKTNNKNDYVVGRLLHWKENCDFFQHKLQTADSIEGYHGENSKNNLYERQVVDVMDENNNKTKAIVYYKKKANVKKDSEVYSGDWLKIKQSKTELCF